MIWLGQCIASFAEPSQTRLIRLGARIDDATTVGKGVGLGLAFYQDLSASSSEALPSFTSIVYGRLLILSVSATIANDKCQAHAS